MNKEEKKLRHVVEIPIEDPPLTSGNPRTGTSLFTIGPMVSLSFPRRLFLKLIDRSLFIPPLSPISHEKHFSPSLPTYRYSSHFPLSAL